MQNQKDSIESTEPSGEKLVVVSIGRHTRLGDVLEYALFDTAFETVDAERFFNGNWTNRRLLFAISADETGENAQLHTLNARLREKDGFLENCVCAVIADDAQGRLSYLDAIALLLAANGAGASMPAHPLIEGDRELRYFSGGKVSPFERYRVQARQLVERLLAAESTPPEHPRLQLQLALEDGAAHDWRLLLERMIETRAGLFSDDQEPDDTILVCENILGLPEGNVLSRLNGGGRLRIVLASPTMGSDLYLACLLVHSCLRGNYCLAPRAVLVFEGLSAVEVLASKRELERVKGILR